MKYNLRGVKDYTEPAEGFDPDAEHTASLERRGMTRAMLVQVIKVLREGDTNSVGDDDPAGIIEGEIVGRDERERMEFFAALDDNADVIKRDQAAELAERFLRGEAVTAADKEEARQARADGAVTAGIDLQESLQECAICGSTMAEHGEGHQFEPEDPDEEDDDFEQADNDDIAGDDADKDQALSSAMEILYESSFWITHILKLHKGELSGRQERGLRHLMMQTDEFLYYYRSFFTPSPMSRDRLRNTEIVTAQEGPLEGQK